VAARLLGGEAVAGRVSAEALVPRLLGAALAAALERAASDIAGRSIFDAMDLEAVATAVGVIVSFGTAVAALVVGHLHEREHQRERAEERAERQSERAEDRAERQREQAKAALYSLNAFAVNTAGPRSKLLDAGEYKRYIDETYYGWGVAARDLDQLRITLGRPDIVQLVDKALQLMTKQFHLVKAAQNRVSA
jgi:hypothetical protein